MRDLFELEYAADPQISPDGHRVVYCRTSFDIMRDRTLSRLWSVKTDGTDHRPLTDADVIASSPRWSPDGKKIAYLASDGNRRQVFCRWINTGQTAQLTQLPESPTGIRWSPNSQQIAFSSFVPNPPENKIRLPDKPKGAQWAEPPKLVTRLKYRADGRGYLREGYHHLFVVPADGGTARQLTQGNYDHEGDFTWSNDSRSIILAANRSPNAELEPNRRNLFQLDLATLRIQKLTNRKGATGTPLLLADGSLLFLGNVDNLKGYQLSRIYRLREDGSEEIVSREFDRNIRGLQLAPNSQQLLFLYDDQGTTHLGSFSTNGEFKKLAGNVGGTTIGRPYASDSFSVSSTDAVCRSC